MSASTTPAPTAGFDSIPAVLSDIRRGRLVVITDDADRENEGDLVGAATKMTAAKINFMAKYGRGLICAPITAERAARLGLQRMVPDNREMFQTDFTVSVDGSPRHGVTTGISAHDRAATIRLLADASTGPRDLVQPGHVFPLKARDGGVLRRAGHTEAAVDLARLAGLDPSAVICEILKENGQMARLPDLRRFARQHGLKIACIEDLIHYRRTREKLVVKEESAPLRTDYGDFQLVLYRSTLDGNRHLVLVRGEVTASTPVLVRVHSESLLSDAFGTRSDLVGNPLHEAMRQIGRASVGVLLYLRCDDHGDDLARQVRALKQIALAKEPSPPSARTTQLREYGLGAQILFDLGVRKMRLLTNHPKYVVGLSGYGLELVEQLPLVSSGSKPARAKTKRPRSKESVKKSKL